MAPKKKVTGLIKLQINAGAANPAPPIGKHTNTDWKIPKNVNAKGQDI